MSLTNLDAIAERIRANLEAKNSARDQALHRSRELIRLCANAIRAAHRNEFAEATKLLEQAHAAADTMKADLVDYPDLYHAGYTQDALKEYAEANITSALIQGRELPEPEALGVEYAAYLNGMGEAAGELRRVWPQAAITTEVMVGYPGEGEVAFENTVRTLRRLRPARVHVFRFSPRPGTRAWGREETAPAESVERRSAVLRALSEEWRREYIKGRTGERRGLLVERITGAGEERIAWGTTEDYMKGALPVPPASAEVGKIITVEVVKLWRGVALMRPMPR